MPVRVGQCLNNSITASVCGGDAVLPVIEVIRERKISYPEDPTYIALRKGDVILLDDYVADEESFRVVGGSAGQRWHKTTHMLMYRKVKKENRLLHVNK